MGCQSLMKTRGMESLKWTEAVKLQLLVVLLIELTAIVSAMSIGDNTVGFAQQKQQQQGYGFHRMPYKSPYQMKKQQLQAQQQQRRMKQTGNEIIPAVGTNAISDEPTCDELRAMWRYYKRQSRAELTNEIPQFGKNPFFEMLPAPRNPMLASFGIGSKPRMKNPLRPQNPLYGRVVQKPSKPRERGRSRNPKPFEVVRELMRNPSGNGMPTNVNVHTAAEAIANRENTQGRVHPADVTEVVTTPGPAIAIVHFSPSRRPPKQSSFQTLRNMIASERQRERETSMGSSSGSPNMGYGKVILSPPTGQDGRRINKPPERMTPFEKIRFGHADDILDEGIRPNLNVMKRRTLPMSVLKTQWKQQQQQNKYQALHKRRFLTNPFPFLIPSSGSSDGSGGSRGGGEGDQTNTYTSSKYFEKRTEENNKDKSTIAITNDKKQLDSLFENDNVPSPLEQDNPIPVFANNDINNNINNGDFKDPVDELSSYSSRSTSSALSKYPTNPLLTVSILLLSLHFPISPPLSRLYFLLYVK